MKHPVLSLSTAIGVVLLVTGCGDSTEPRTTEPSDGAVPTVVTAEVTEIDLYSATSGGEITHDGGSAVNARGVVWSLWRNPTIENDRTADGSGSGSFRSVLTGLEPGTTYHVRAYATSSQGTGYGYNRSFRTSQGTIRDIDGNQYEIVRIGDHWWMAENLRVTRYRNGDAIPTNLSNAEWEKARHGAYAIYPHSLIDGLDSDSAVVAAYGKLYNWFTVDDPRGICPDGWRVPNDTEWSDLGTYLGGVLEASAKLKSSRTEPNPHPRWNKPNVACNETGWSGLPGGRRLFNGGHSGIGTNGNWLASIERDEFHSWSRILSYGTTTLFTNYSFKTNGNSIRCMKDAED